MPVQAQRAATANATVVNGFVVGVAVTDGGAGYPVAPAVTISGGGVFGAAAFARVASGVVTQITLTSAGSGYSSTPAVVIMSITWWNEWSADIECPNLRNVCNTDADASKNA